MTSTSFLSESIERPRSLSKADRSELLCKCWQLQYSKFESVEIYIGNYENQCQIQPGESIGQLTHGEVFNAFTTVTTSRKTRQQCIQDLSLRMPKSKIWPQDALAKELILFVGKALLLLDLSQWGDQQTLKDFLHDYHFPRSSIAPERIKLTGQFNLRHLTRAAGFQIEWTKSLDRHLMLTDEDKKVVLFHLVSAFEIFEKSKVAEIFPEHLFIETRKTMSLLLPPKSRRWFDKQQMTHKLDKGSGACSYLRMEHRNTASFDVWRERLMILKETYDEHEPQDLREFWLDDRKSVQWWAFWIAFVVFLIALIQCVEGALQVYKAYHPS